MLELTTLAAGIKTVKELYSALSILKEVRQNQALLDKLMEVQDLRATLLDARDEILTLREKVGDLEAKQQAQSDLEFDPRRGFYWSSREGKRLAYCAKCWGEHSRLSPMTEMSHAHYCTICRTGYSNPDYTLPPQKHTPNPYTGD